MENFQGNSSPDTGNSIKDLPNFIKPGPNSPSAAGGSPPGSSKKGIALDSLEPVIVSGISSIAGGSTGLSNQISSPNNPSPQNFASS